jgi:hypothetical protein
MTYENEIRMKVAELEKAFGKKEKTLILTQERLDLYRAANFMGIVYVLYGAGILFLCQASHWDILNLASRLP